MKTTLLAACILSGAIVSAFAQAMPPTERPPAGAMKICAPYTPNMFRLTTNVPGTWSIDDCRGYATSVGATFTQVGCFFEKEPRGLTTKWVLGIATPSENAPTLAHLPEPNCGW